MKNLIFYILWPTIAGLVFAGVVLVATDNFGQWQPVVESGTETGDPNPAVSLPESFSYSFSEAVSRASPAIVSINTEVAFDTGRRRYLPRERRVEILAEVDKSQGSGVIISSDGYIISSLHIFESNRAILDSALSITLSDGRVLPARPVAIDEFNDLILLKLNVTGLPYMSVGGSRPLSVGDMVVAIGNPRNLGRSASFGIISALPSTGDSYLIQTDAAINPGNSGGALIDFQGRLIGITSRIVSESGGFEGIGFATPAEKGVRLMNAFLESAPNGYLGIESDAQSLVPLPSVNEISIGGLKVQGVVPGSAAETAGILPGDIITAVNDIKVEIADGARNFMNAISSFEPGQSVEVKVFRQGEFLVLEAVLGLGAERPFLEMPEPTALDNQSSQTSSVE